ncbi:MAG TPA: tetratricopeptide repeat protein [Terriglobales bacterium]|jgi:tetratricopeptide (TPR) repeat protein
MPRLDKKHGRKAEQGRVASLGVSSATAVRADPPAFQRRWFLVLACIALVYAFLAGLRTVADYDTGWQLATGRWVVQHHQIPSVDVLSYTAQGQPWTYPVGAGVIFYLAFLMGGYTLVSCMGAAACVGAVALLLRRGSPLSAGLALLAVPLIALRTPPRADAFSVVLFAAFLSLLWENYQTGRAHLWLLPLLMLVWVNVHFGFVAGLALMLAYAGMELSETILGEARRRAAILRLRRASGWLLCAAVVTLVNPWGWGVYRALLLQTRAAGHQEVLIAEWTSLPLNWVAFSRALWLRDTRGALYLLLAIAVVAAVVALFRAQWWGAILLLTALYAPVRHVRMGAVFSCVVVIVGGSILWEAVLRLSSHIRPSQIGSFVAIGAVALLAALASARSFDLVTNRHYFGGDTDNATFGAGLSWWFPQRAVEFIQSENVPGEIFNGYNAGGYLSWALGPQRRDYIDGRDTLFGTERIERARHLLESSPDSAIWQQEADQYHINSIILSLARYDGLQFVRLKDFCNSRDWRPVYLDEVSAVFVRRKPETEDLILRSKVDCATAPLPASTPAQDSAGAFNRWANAASVLSALDRNYEALAATDKAIAIFPGSAIVHLVRAHVLGQLSRFPEAEREYRAAVSLHPDEFTWSALADFYRKQNRDADAIQALQKAVQLQARPELSLVQLGYYFLQLGQPKEALAAFDKAVQSAAPEVTNATGRGSFRYNVATGRARAYEILGDVQRAISYQEEAIRLAPDAPQPWLNLAQLYHLDGRSADEERAKAHAATLIENQRR